jgi:hypothetical protein
MVPTPDSAAPTDVDRHRRARRMWRLLEPVHAVVYFAPDIRGRFEAVGLKGFWMAYFAGRSAPLGRPSPEVVEATFYVFHPAMVRRAIPDAWSLADPARVLAERERLASEVLRSALGADADGPAITTAADRLVEVARGAPMAGRPLAAAHLTVPVPDDPLTRLWWAATVLREHRGDGHMASLVAADLDGCEALALTAAAGATGPDGARLLQASRRWPDDEWAAANQRLCSRGLIDEQDAITAVGRDTRQAVEDRTDRAAWRAYAALDDTTLEDLDRVLLGLARTVGARVIPQPNPIGLDTSALD